MALNQYVYYKITDEDETHYGLTYHTGLNIDPKPFGEPVEGNPSFKYGIHITNYLGILYNLNRGIYLREANIPNTFDTKKELVMTHAIGSDETKLPATYRVNQVILKERIEITLDIIKELLSTCENMTPSLFGLLYRWSVRYTKIDVLDYLLNDEELLKYKEEDSDYQVILSALKRKNKVVLEHLRDNGVITPSINTYQRQSKVLNIILQFNNEEMNEYFQFFYELDCFSEFKNEDAFTNLLTDLIKKIIATKDVINTMSMLIQAFGEIYRLEDIILCINDLDISEEESYQEALRILEYFNTTLNHQNEIIPYREKYVVDYSLRPNNENKFNNFILWYHSAISVDLITSIFKAVSLHYDPKTNLVSKFLVKQGYRFTDLELVDYLLDNLYSWDLLQINYLLYFFPMNQSNWKIDNVETHIFEEYADLFVELSYIDKTLQNLYDLLQKYFK